MLSLLEAGREELSSPTGNNAGRNPNSDDCDHSISGVLTKVGCKTRG